MATTIETLAIILERQPLREYDRRIIVLSKDFGRLDLVAQGTQRITSKLAGSLEPLSEIRLHFSHGRTDRVIGSVLLQTWPSLRKDLQAFAAGNFLAQVVNKLFQPNETDQELYAELQTTLSAIDAESEKAGYYTRRFLWRMFEHLGLRPRLDECVRCGDELEDQSWYSAEAGGVLCAKCKGKGYAMVELEAKDREALEKLRNRESIADTQSNDILAKVIKETLQIYTGQRLPSETFWSQINRLDELKG